MRQVESPRPCLWTSVILAAGDGRDDGGEGVGGAGPRIRRRLDARARKPWNRRPQARISLRSTYNTPLGPPSQGQSRPSRTDYVSGRAAIRVPDTGACRSL